MLPDLLNSVRRLLQRCRILQQTLLRFPKNTKQMMRLLTFCELVNSERLLFRKFNFEFKLLLQEIFPLQILNKTALNKNIITTKCTNHTKATKLFSRKINLLVCSSLLLYHYSPGLPLLSKLSSKKVFGYSTCIPHSPHIFFKFEKKQFQLIRRLFKLYKN